MNPTEVPMNKEPSDPTAIPNQCKTVFHVNDFLSYCILETNRDKGLAYAHFMFTYFTQPAWVKDIHRPYMADHKLFVDYEKQTWRVTGASRLGDIWLSRDLDREFGYDLRVRLDITKLTNWRAHPNL